MDIELSLDVDEIFEMLSEREVEDLLELLLDNKWNADIAYIQYLVDEEAKR